MKRPKRFEPLPLLGYVWAQACANDPDGIRTYGRWCEFHRELSSRSSTVKSLILGYTVELVRHIERHGGKCYEERRGEYTDDVLIVLREPLPRRNY